MFASPASPTAAPFLLIGAGRGGTSLLAGCLERHPDIVMRMEFRSAETLMGEGEHELPDALDMVLLHRLGRFRSACDGDRATVPGKVWGNKITTEQILGLGEHNLFNFSNEPIVARFVEAMAGYRIIFITRDGRTCVNSKVRRTGQPATLAAMRWCASVRMLDQLRSLGALAGCWRYEDLLRAPEETLSAVAQTLGVGFHPRMLDGPRSPGLPGAYRHGRLLSEKATEKVRLPPGIESLIRPDLVSLGYAED